LAIILLLLDSAEAENYQKDGIASARPQNIAIADGTENTKQKR
jgi:hypothetical protein